MEKCQPLPGDVLSYRSGNGVGFYELDEAWRPKDIVVAFSTRIGGISQGPFAALNLGMHVGDESQMVLANRQRLSDALAITASHWVVGQQVHESNVAAVFDHHRGRGASAQDTAIPGVDGLVTATPQLWLTCFYADCVPIVFWDVQARAVGIAHAGWRGTLRNVGGAVVENMIQRFGCHPANIHAVIGPSIGPCCYFVGEDVAEGFRLQFQEGVVAECGGEITLDLKEANRQHLVGSGLPAAQVHVSKLCTACHGESFFSYRRDKSPTGRMVAIVGLR